MSEQSQVHYIITHMRDGGTCRWVSVIEEHPSSAMFNYRPYIERTPSIIISNSRASFVASYAFYSSPNLVSVNLPNCVSVGSHAFQTCTSLSGVGVYLPICEYIDEEAFSTCNQLVRVVCSNIKYIASSAFYSCYRFKGIYSESDAQYPVFRECSYIGDYAFYKSTSTHSTSFYFLSPRVITLGGSSVFGPGTTAFYVPASLYSDYLSAEYWSLYSSRIQSVSI